MTETNHIKTFLSNPISYVSGMVALGAVVFAWGVSSARFSKRTAHDRARRGARPALKPGQQPVSPICLHRHRRLGETNDRRFSPLRAVVAPRPFAHIQRPFAVSSPGFGGESACWTPS